MAANKNLTDQIKVALEQNKVLTMLLQKNLGGKKGTKKEDSPNKRTRLDMRTDNTENNWEPLGYCKSHGYNAEVGHNSCGCHWG